jgi:hypothetical protein
MKVYLNEQHVERRSSVGKWASLLGLAILAIGFVVSIRYPNVIISFGTLAVGFILSNVGIYYANRYTRLDRPDAVLAKALKGLDNRYALYQFLLPSAQVLREPGGLTVLVLKPQDGIVLYQDGKWRHKMGWSRALRWMGQEGLGRPEQEVELEVETLKNWLQEQAPDLDVPVRGVVVFTQADLQTPDEPPAPAMAPKQIKGWLRKAGKLPTLPKQQLAQLTRVLNEAILIDE